MKPKKDFTYYRWVNGLNTFLQAALALLLFGGAMHLAGKFFWRADLTDNRRYSLSAETVAYLENLEEPVRVVVTISPSNNEDAIDQLYRDVRGLLREYEYAARNNSGTPFQVEFVNIFQQRKQAQLIASEYGVEQENRIIFASGDRQRVVFPNEIYETRERERSGFRGEQVFTSALLDVTSDEQKTLYFVTGHREMRFDDTDPYRGLSQLGDVLEQRNFRLRYLSLTQADRVPEDADVVLLISPQTPLLSREEEILRRYLANEAGRLIAMIDPGQRHGLSELFYEWGIHLDDVFVMDDGPDALAGGGDLILNRYGEHPITQSLIENNLPLISGYSRSVREDLGRPLDDSLTVQNLIYSSPTSWGERSYWQADTFAFDPDTDLEGPLSLAAVSERQLPSQLGINMPGGRVVVFGTSDLISNNRMALGNLTLFLNTINWIVDRDSATSIPPRPIEQIQLVLSRENIHHLRLTLLAILPGFVALSGVTVYWIRRK